jgi:Domain of Unknown Function (DUF1080)/FG-GAP-like repeat
MSERYRAVILATAVCFCFLFTLRADAPPTTLHPFNGTSLAGWHTLGAAKWQAENGAIAASSKSGADGWLILDKGYEDVILNLAFQCASCQGGILLRNAPIDGGRTSGLYVPLSGPDTANVYRVTLDAQGKELDRKLISARKPRNSLANITPLPGGWSEFSLMLHGAPAVDGGRGPAARDDGSRYGQLALGVSSGDLRIKDISLTNLLNRRLGLPDEVTGQGFRRVQLTDRYYSEGITAGDFNHDGVMDVAAGPYYYPGPSFQTGVEIYEPRTYSIGAANQAGGYTDSFILYAYDFNNDGWNDILKVNYCCAEQKPGVYLYINSKTDSRHWDEYKVVETNDSETTAFGDVDGDGKPELIMTLGRDPNRVVGYAKPDWANATKPWTFHAVTPKGSYGGHAAGFGDVNGDGRTDILAGTAWIQQPAAGAESGLWEVHPAPFGRGNDPFVRGADMFLYDVNGDGLPDVITSLFAHGPGLAWWEQQRNGAAISWKMHMIMDKPEATPEERKSWEETDKSVSFTELHGLALADIDGDGVKDIVTGKRWWSHGIEYPEDDFDAPPVVYWFKLARKQGGQVEFVPGIVTNVAGLGTQITAADVNGDGRPDILTAGRRGAYVYLNTGAK